VFSGKTKATFVVVGIAFLLPCWIFYIQQKAHERELHALHVEVEFYKDKNFEQKYHIEHLKWEVISAKLDNSQLQRDMEQLQLRNELEALALATYEQIVPPSKKSEQDIAAFRKQLHEENCDESDIELLQEHAATLPLAEPKQALDTLLKDKRSPKAVREFLEKALASRAS
jgi:hypothetical protein